jgi:peptidoglycan hydrolase CwlO-like protein
MQHNVAVYLVLGLIAGSLPVSTYSYLQMNSVQANLESTKTLAETREKENSNLQGQLSELSKKVDSLREEVGALNKEIAAKEQMITSINQNILQLQTDKAGLTDQLTKLKVDSQKLEGEKTALEQQARSLSGQITTLQQSISSLQAERTSLQQQVTSLTTERNNLQAQINPLQSQILSLANERNSLQSQVNLLQGQVSALTTERNSLKRDSDQLKAKWDLWQTQSNLAPQTRGSISVLGYYPQAGTYRVDQPSIIISFPNPASCFQVWHILGTSSMRPAIDAGHELIANTCFTKDDFRPGDIITYSNSLGNIIHQITEIRSEGVITKGIHNDSPDSLLVKWEEITGLVVAIIY